MANRTVTQAFDVLILGAGAAGLMCAIEAGRGGKRVAVLDHADRIGKKILISGGGRCNFTNIYCSPDNFLSANPHFCKSALARYTPHDFLALVSKHGIPYHEKTLGQLFCDRSARDIVALLEEECRQAGVHIFLNAKVEKVHRTASFEVRTQDAVFSSDALVVATGGLSIPKMGATPFGYRVGGPVWNCRATLPSGTGPASVRQQRPCRLWGPRRSVDRSAGSLPGTTIPRKSVDHSSWIERPGDSADFFVLEARRTVGD